MMYLFLMAILLFSFGMMSGCDNISQPVYNHDTEITAEVMNDSFQEDNELNAELNISKSVTCNLESANNLKLLDDDLSLLISESHFSKFIFQIRTNFTGFAVTDIEFTFDNGKSEKVHLDKMCLSRVYELTCPKSGEQITNISISLVPCKGTCSGTYIMNEENNTDVTLTGQNTLHSNYDGCVLLLDKEMKVVDSLIVKKGGCYATTFGVRYYIKVY